MQTFFWDLGNKTDKHPCPQGAYILVQDISTGNSSEWMVDGNFVLLGARYFFTLMNTIEFCQGTVKALFNCFRWESRSGLCYSVLSRIGFSLRGKAQVLGKEDLKAH